MRNDRAMRPVFNLGSTVGIIAIGFSLLAGCSTARAHGPSRQAEVGPSPTVRLPLKAHGLPDNFFELGADTKCSSQIIGYRFVVWLNSDAVAVGFNTSPNCRRSPNESVSGALRVLVFDSKGALKASRELPYLADGNGELVADGEASQAGRPSCTGFRPTHLCGRLVHGRGRSAQTWWRVGRRRHRSESRNYGVFEVGRRCGLLAYSAGHETVQEWK